MFLVSVCSCLCAIYWRQVLSGQWRYSLSTDGLVPFSLTNCYILIQISMKLVPKGQINNLSTLVHIRALSVTSHYLNKWWSNLLTRIHPGSWGPRVQDPGSLKIQWDTCILQAQIGKFVMYLISMDGLLKICLGHLQIDMVRASNPKQKCIVNFS